MHTYAERVFVDVATGRPLAGRRATVVDAETEAPVQAYRNGEPVTLVSGAHGVVDEFQTESTTRRVRVSIDSRSLSSWALELPDDALAAADRAEAAAAEAASEATAAIATQVDVVQRTAAQVSDRVTSGADPEIVAAVVDAESRRTWMEAGADGGPTALARRHIGVEDDPTRPDVLAVSDGSRIVPILDSRSRLSPLLLRWSSRYGRAEVPAAAGGVRSDAVLARNAKHGGAWEPESGTDDSMRLDALIRSVAEEGGGTVVLPPGATLATVTLMAGVSLVGAGRRQTALVAPSGSGKSVVRTSAATGPRVYRARIADFTIHGNRWAQPAVVPRGSVENYGAGQHGIWISHSSTTSPDDEGLDLFHDVENITIRDVRNVGIMARSTPGESRYRNVTVWRAGIGAVSGPDSFWNMSTFAENEHYGVYNMHGSTTWSNVKVFRTGAFVNTGGTGTTAYLRRAAPGWYLAGYGALATLAACTSQNNGGHGLHITESGHGANIQLQSDANNQFGTSQWGQFPPSYDGDTVGTGNQVYAGDGVTRGVINPEDFVGAYIEGSGNIVRLGSVTATEQNAGTHEGNQIHALALGPNAAGNDVTLVHHSNSSAKPAQAPLRGTPTGRNRVLAGGRLIDEVTA
ncbi:hypothetical protein [Micrococcus lylae]|uniref:hypothetical protein n=1 Tax=Micrococcus lylae TaxID=1273 RepID=UPI000C801567|nr:hypothetical protein [Micrococcus lylae]WIK82175.1 hypothetical protein CJ228_011405 [Micrococcus lylae]